MTDSKSRYLGEASTYRRPGGIPAIRTPLSQPRAPAPLASSTESARHEAQGAAAVEVALQVRESSPVLLAHLEIPSVLKRSHGQGVDAFLASWPPDFGV